MRSAAHPQEAQKEVSMRTRTAAAEKLPGPIASLAGWVAGEIVEVKAQRAGRIDRVAAPQGSLGAERELLFSLEPHDARPALPRAPAARLDSDVRAPVSGRMLDVWVSAGQLVEPGQALGSILRDDYTFVAAIFAAG